MKKFRVEAFIIPTVINNDFHNESQVSNDRKLGKEVAGVNVIDDVKLANKLKEKSSDDNCHEENLKEGTNEDQDNNLAENMVTTSLNVSRFTESNLDISSEFSGEFFALDEHIYDEIVLPKTSLPRRIKIVSTKSKPRMMVTHDYNEYSKVLLKIKEPIYDEPYVGTLPRNTRDENVNYDVPQPIWALAQSKYRRYGILAPKLPKRTSSLHSIIEDIELDNHNESCLSQCCGDSSGGPERVSDGIFMENWMQKLCALRDLETLLKDKEIALQSRERLLFRKEKDLRILEKLIKDKMRQPDLHTKRRKKSRSSDSIDRRSYRSNQSHEDTINNIISHHQMKKLLRFWQESNFSATHNGKKKIVDDADTALFADIGSPMATTTKKFDPVNLKKNFAFARSLSERKAPLKQGSETTAMALANSNSNTQPIDKSECMKHVVDPAQEKIFKRFSENILACQNQETKFHSYGLIDESVMTNKEKISKENNNVISDKKFSYLNLETISKTLKFKNNTKVVRPTSWNEETDNWLKKKRQAYNALTSKSAAVTEKENNCFMNDTKNDRLTKGVKNKDGKEKKFSIFR